MKNRSVIKLTAIVVVCSVVSFFIGYFVSVGTLVSWRNVFLRPLGDWFRPQQAIFLDKDDIDPDNIEAFNTVKDILQTRFYEPVDINEMFNYAIKGLAQGTKDLYTVYYDPEEMKQFLEDTTGNYVGIGVSVSMDENSLLTVAEVFPDSPAKEAGIRIGDKIVKVDDEDVTMIKDAELIVKRIKGARDTVVKITVYRPDASDYIDYVMTRRAINVSYIFSEMLENNIGYIRIKQFDNDIARDFAKHLDLLIAHGARGLVIDLRNNPGGDYQEVVRICDMLLPRGLIVYVQDRDGNRSEEYSDERELNMPISVLVNGYSASASEIMSAALKDYGKGVLVGTKTYGKGLVQQIETGFANGGGLKYTIARYYTPSGACIQGTGIEPDIEIEMIEEYKYTSIDDIPHNKDNQLKAAVDEVMRQLH